MGVPARRGGAFKINGRLVRTLRLREVTDNTNYLDFEVLIEDSQFGLFAVTPNCRIEFMDLTVPREHRNRMIGQGWKTITYSAFCRIVDEIRMVD